MAKRFKSTKTYCHSQGLSACFRQWRAESHCSRMHGYSLEFRIVFEAIELDEHNWAVDFGGLKHLRAWLELQFDHRTLVAEDDPHLETFKDLDARKIINLNIVPAVGCEKFAEMVFDYITACILPSYGGRIKLSSVEVREHESNSAIVEHVDD